MGFCVSCVVGDGFHVGSRAQEKLTHTSAQLSHGAPAWMDVVAAGRRVPRWPQLPLTTNVGDLALGGNKKRLLNFSVCCYTNCVGQALFSSLEFSYTNTASFIVFMLFTD